MSLDSGLGRSSRESTIRLLLDAVQQALDLATKELRLLGTELDAIAASVAALVSSFGGAFLAVWCGFLLILLAAAKFLGWLTGSEVIGAVLVAAPFAAAAIALGYWGLSRTLSVGRLRR
jgi:hypothetical protein